jgi:hypothetical protein
MTKHPSARSACQRTENPCVDSSILSLGTADRTAATVVDRNARREAYLAAYQASGLTRAEAEARQAEVERFGRTLGRQIKLGKLSPAKAIQRIRSAFDVSAPSAARGVQ